MFSAVSPNRGHSAVHFPISWEATRGSGFGIGRNGFTTKPNLNKYFSYSDSFLGPRLLITLGEARNKAPLHRVLHARSLRRLSGMLSCPHRSRGIPYEKTCSVLRRRFVACDGNFLSIDLRWRGVRRRLFGVISLLSR